MSVPGDWQAPSIKGPAGLVLEESQEWIYMDIYIFYGLTHLLFILIYWFIINPEVLFIYLQFCVELVIWHQ